MAIHVGAKLQSVTIDPDWDDGPSRFGDVVVEWPAGRFSQRQFQEKSVLVALAGPVVEMIHSGDPFHPALVAEWAQDWQQAWETAADLIPDERRRMAFLESRTVELYQMLKQDHFWAAIAAVVDHLLAHETLDGDDVEEIVRTWL